DAVAEFQTVSRLVPDLALAHTNLGATYIDLGQYEQAESEYRTALRLKETQPAFENMGALLAYERRDAEAGQFYKRALAIPPAHFRLWMNLADSYPRIGRLNEGTKALPRGEEFAERDLGKDPRDGYARAFAAYFYARLGEIERAELEIEQALSFSPSDAKVLRRAAILYEALGRRENALRVLTAAPHNLLDELSRQPDLAD